MSVPFDGVTVLTDKHRIPFVIDAEDLEAVSRYTWNLDGEYIATNIGKWPNGQKRRLHVFLLGRAPDGLEWDHENRDKLDNRRSNLRPVTVQVNSRNVGPGKCNRSGVRGVYRRTEPRPKPWVAQIRVGDRQKNLGSFATIEEAIAARRAAEVEVWGEHSPLCAAHDVNPLPRPGHRDASEHTRC